MELVNYLRRSSIKRFLGMLLIVVFAVKSCDLLIYYCAAYHKVSSTENPAENEKAANDENSSLGEKSFDKNGKKLFSFFDNATSFKFVIWITDLSIPQYFYGFSSFKEPLRVVITPPPDLLFV